MLLVVTCMVIMSPIAILAYHEIINELQNHVNTNKTFAEQLNRTFVEAGYGPGSGYPVTYTMTYETLNTWLTQPPNITSYLYNTVTQFSCTYTGSALCSTNYVINWWKEYLNDYHNYLNSYNSTYVLEYWLNWSEINMSDYIIPPNGYQSFNQFFIRKLQPNARPISSPDNDSIIISPNDGEVMYVSGLNSLNVNNSDLKLKIKGVEYNVGKILDTTDNNIINKYSNGTIVQILLAAYNYHRYHAPISGKVVNIIDIEGSYFYNAWYARTSFELIIMEWAENNRRGAIFIENEKLNTTVVYVAIGVCEFSSVNWSVNVGDIVEKGDEIGNFAVGGSTAVLLFENGVVDQIFVEKDQLIQMGQAVVSLKN